jgi:hypothetical protein
MIPHDPTQYSLPHLPERGASAAVVQRIASKGTLTNDPPYRLVLRIHSLQQAGPGMFIEQIVIQPRDIRDVPDPLRVWLNAAALDYQTNPFSAIYTGRTGASTLAARYAGRYPEAHVRLKPGEADEVGILITSDVPVDLKFRIQILYRVSSEIVMRTLNLPYDFEVIFADARNWQTYQFRDGVFSPG